MKIPLRSIPPSVLPGKRVKDVIPKPQYLGTKDATPEQMAETARALRRVIQDHSWTKPRENRVDVPSKWTMFLWSIFICMIVVLSAILNKPAEPSPKVKTYSLQPQGQ